MSVQSLNARKQNKKEYKKMENTKLTMSVEEMADAVGIGRALAYDLVKRPGFPALRINGRIIIPVDALKKWLNDQAFGGSVCES